MVDSLGASPFADTEDRAALRQLARDVAERELAPMARHGDETEEFPQWSWDAMRKAELFGIGKGGFFVPVTDLVTLLLRHQFRRTMQTLLGFNYIMRGEAILPNLAISNRCHRL